MGKQGGGHKGGGFVGGHRHGSGWPDSSPDSGIRHQPDEFGELLLPERYPLDADAGFAETERRQFRERDHLDAYAEVFNPTDVGRFIRPRDNYWVSHKAAVLAGAPFDPTQPPEKNKYRSFDGLVVKYARLPKVFDPDNRHYAENATARLNVAVLRNYLINHFYPDGPTGDEMKDLENRNRLRQVAIEVGDMLHRGNGILPTVFGTSLSPSKLQAEGTGAARMYHQLLSAQRHEHMKAPFVFLPRLFKHQMDRDWRLPRIEETPFHPRNLAAPMAPVSYSGAIGGEAPMAVAIPAGLGIEALAAGLASPPVVYGRAEDLSDPVKQRAIEIARDILEKLRIRFGDVPVAQMMDRLDSASARELFAQADQVSSIFRDHLAGNANLLQDPAIRGAVDAMGMLTYQAQRFALHEAGASGDTAAAEAIAKAMRDMPAEWQNTGALTLGNLMSHMQFGLDALLARLQNVSQETGGVELRDRAVETAAAAAQDMSAEKSPIAAAAPNPVAAKVQEMHRREQAMADSGLHTGKHKPAEPPAASQAMAAPARPSRHGKASRGPKLPKTAPAVAPPPVAAPAAKPMDGLLTREQVASMKQSMGAATSGPAMNPVPRSERHAQAAASMVSASAPIRIKPPKSLEEPPPYDGSPNRPSGRARG